MCAKSWFAHTKEGWWIGSKNCLQQPDRSTGTRLSSSTTHPVRPCALLADDTPIFDSRVICTYVDSLASPEGSLYPQDARRFTVLTLEALADSILDACLLCRYEKVMRPEAFFWEDWYRSQMDKVDSGLDALEGRWFADISGDFHAGAIAAACALGYLDFRFADKDWRGSRPQLASWFAKVSERPSMKETLPPA